MINNIIKKISLHAHGNIDIHEIKKNFLGINANIKNYPDLHLSWLDELPLNYYHTSQYCLWNYFRSYLYISRQNSLHISHYVRYHVSIFYVCHWNIFQPR